jgi:hypothetical protein
MSNLLAVGSDGAFFLDHVYELRNAALEDPLLYAYGGLGNFDPYGSRKWSTISLNQFLLLTLSAVEGEQMTLPDPSSSHSHTFAPNSIDRRCLPFEQTYPDPHTTSVVRVVSVHSVISPDESQALKYPPWTVWGADEPAGQNLSAPPHSFCTRLVLPALREGTECAVAGGGGWGLRAHVGACGVYVRVYV